MVRDTAYVDVETGEVYSRKRRFVDVQFDEEKGYLFWNRRSHVKTFNHVDFPAEMSFADIGRMAKLAKRVWRDTNMLAYRSDGGVKPYDVERIAEVIGLGPRQAYRFIAKMINLGIMAKVKVEVGGKKEIHYYLNPIHFCSSNRINLNLYLLFRDQLDQVLPEWVKQKFAESERKQKEKEGARRDAS